MSSEALWRGSDSQFGYSPFVNRNFQFKVCSSYRVRDFVLSNSRAYTCHIINSCTSALLELIIRRGGVHLGDAGGFCDQWEIGWSDPKTERGFHKRSVIKLLGEGTDYLEQISKGVTQKEFLDAAKKYIEKEREERSISFVICSTFMAYTNNVVNGATLRALCAWCEAKDLHLIMDDTLGSFRLSGDLCSWNGVINFYPHGYILGSKTFGCASLWIKSNLFDIFV